METCCGVYSLSMVVKGTVAAVLVVIMIMIGSLMIGSRTLLLSRRVHATSHVELRGGSTPWEGELVWTVTNTSICRQTLTQQDADVICRSLFPDRAVQRGRLYDVSLLKTDSEANRTTTVALVQLGCTGSENIVEECPRFSAREIPAVSCPTGTGALTCEAITVETVTSLTCTDDLMKVRVNLTELGWLYNDSDPAYISLINEGCTGKTTGDIWSIDNPHSQCYTQRKIDGDIVQYRNAIIYKERGIGPIAREHRWRVDLKCNFRRQMQVGLNYSLSEMKNYEMNLTSDYTAHIHLYNDSSLNTELHAGQVRARLGEDLFVKIVLDGEWNVTMHLMDCVARPLPASSTSYTLIQNGSRQICESAMASLKNALYCPTDSETFIVYTTNNSTLFHFKAFEFYAGYSTVYVNCDVTYCAPFDDNPRCDGVCS